MNHIATMPQRGPSSPAKYRPGPGRFGIDPSSKRECRQIMNTDSPNRQFPTKTAPTTCQKKSCSMRKSTQPSKEGQHHAA